MAKITHKYFKDDISDESRNRNDDIPSTAKAEDVRFSYSHEKAVAGP